MTRTALLFLITYCGGLIATLTVDGVYGILLYEIEYFLNPRSRWWFGQLPNLRYSLMIGLCIFLAYILKMKDYSKNRFFQIPHNRWFVAMAVLLFFVSFVAVTPKAHWKSYSAYLKVLVFIFLMYKLIDTPQRFEKMIWAFLIGQFYLGWLAHSMGRTGGGGRLEGIGPTDGTDSNMVGAIFITSIPLLIFYIIKAKKRWQKGLGLLAMAYIMDGLVLVNSRGAFLGLLVGLSYMSYFVFFKKGDKKFKRQMAAGLVVGVLSFLYLTDATFWGRMETLTTVEVGDEGLEGAQGGASRTFFWMKAIELVKEHPFGVGAWGYVYLSPQFIPEHLLTKTKGGGGRAVHSTWFEALSEFGYAGFFFFVMYIFSFFSLMRKVRKTLLMRGEDYLYFQSIAINAGFIAYLTAATFINRFFAELMYWIPAFGACFANIYYLKQPFIKDRGNES